MDLFDPHRTNRPNRDLFYSRHDVNDVRLGDVVRTDPADYRPAHIVILGCPQDEGVRRNGGRPGAQAAPTEIRRCLYRLTTNHIPEHLALFDLGDTAVQPSLEETHALQRDLVRQIIRDDKRLIVLGGGNDISYPDCSGLAQAAGAVQAINVDAHFDVRADHPCNSGTPYRQLIEGGFFRPEWFFEVGYQPFSNSPDYKRYLQEQGAHLISRRELRDEGVQESIRRVLTSDDTLSLFWGFDLDVVCAADAPGVSAPNPTGLAGDELCLIAELAGADARTRMVEFSEVNPNYDLDLRTCRLAATAIWHYLSSV
jgi:formiminoglutamase